MSFIKTFSGKHFYYDKINKDDIDINDIAVSLSNICRFAGHLSHFYSVAQHAVLCSQLVPQEFAFEALMHDATEAYCQDILNTATTVSDCRRREVRPRDVFHQP
ncbi:hypothetical protein ECDEC12A_5375, partial [Escherichia coli DEC12A]